MKKINFYSKYSFGFTLVEFLTIIAIMGIMLATGIVALVMARQNRQVSSVADKIKSIITETRSFAFSPPESVAGAEYIEIYIDKSNNTISFSSVVGTQPHPIDPVIINDTTMPSNITFYRSYTIDINISDPNKIGQFSRDNNICLYGSGNQPSYYKLLISSEGQVNVVKGTSCP